MKPNTLSVKRRPVSKGVFKRLYAATGRKQRAATTADDLDIEDNSAKISRSLTVIVLFHLVVIGLIFFHQQYLEGHSDVAKASEDTGIKPLPNTAPKKPVSENLPMLTPDEPTYMVKTGDNYSRIAAGYQVDELELRALNNNADIRAGNMIKIPTRKVASQTSPVSVPLEPQEPVGVDAGLVDAVPVGSAPRAVVVKPAANVTQANTVKAAAKPETTKRSGKTYVVKSGDNLWQIAKRNNVSVDALKKANNIKDERKVKIGTTLVMP